MSSVKTATSLSELFQNDAKLSRSPTSKAPIAKIENENPNIVRIDKAEKDPSSVFITGLSRGTARLIFTDVNKATEAITIRTDDSEQRRLDLAFEIGGELGHQQPFGSTAADERQTVCRPGHAHDHRDGQYEIDP